MAGDTDDNLQSLLTSLEIPAEYGQSGLDTSPETLARLDAWKLATVRVLRDLKEQLKDRELSLTQQANVIAATASFKGQGPWITPETHHEVSEILAKFIEPSLLLLTQLLETNVNPLFRSNPHPSLNLSTGRKLDRPAGGPEASFDFFETQAWKKYPGAANLVFWCLHHIQAHDYDRLWYLVIPPVMTFLDDYQVPYKLKGVEMINELLQRLPREILKRTGVDGLVQNSLNTCLAQLDDPESPKLIQAAVSASLSLTLLTTSPGSATQFDQLCGLLGERIIGTIWLYSYDKGGVILASVDALPPVLSALGLGCTRYLKALVPQLVHPLLPAPFKSNPMELRLGSLRALMIVIRECSYRMSTWKGTIMDGISRCWVSLADNTPTEDDCMFSTWFFITSLRFNAILLATRNELKMQLRSTCEVLAEVCPTVIEGEFRRLLSTDQEMFQGLVAGIA
ncbi:hypothetical protein GYMLUDRAFT_905811 [Collybiopsis luxurians FD-317 M1]|uniref:Uncharacterized protein n=1 Tax=Collybiopsis luxurians FD-317 M1 TaxID=944289 RepID=A0A0D0AVB1_9AGAR|nr:hypothetical protein GYMLUDRAFT_905811 [Collybiopsis luxurians FD-317 M1]